MFRSDKSDWTTVERARIPVGGGNALVVSTSTRRRRYDGREEHRAVLRIHFPDGGHAGALFMPIGSVPELLEKLGDAYEAIEGERP